jgi:hypothetical protein
LEVSVLLFFLIQKIIDLILTLMQRIMVLIL